MKHLTLLIILTALCIHSMHFIYAQEGKPVAISDNNITIFPGKIAETCIAVGAHGIYKVHREGTRKLSNRHFILMPAPTINSSSSLLAIIVQNEETPCLTIFDIENRSGKEIPLPDYPSSIKWVQDKDILIIAIDKALYRLDIDESDLVRYPQTYSGLIQSFDVDSTGNRAVLTVSINDSDYTQTMLVDLNEKDEPQTVSTYSYGITRIGSNRIAYIAGQGEPDSLVYVHKLDEEGKLTPIPHGRKQVAALGTPGIAQALSISPQGDVLAILTRVNSPIDFFGADASYYSTHVVEFAELNEKSDKPVQSTPIDIFAWSPTQNVYGMVQKRIHEKPRYEISHSGETKVDYQILRSSKTANMSKRNYTKDDSLLITNNPVDKICWSRDGSIMYAVEQASSANIWFFPFM